MSTHALPHATRAPLQRLRAVPAAAHALWLAGGFLLAFLIPFVLADTLELNRDVFYGLYGAAVIAYVWAWGRRTGQSVRHLVSRRLGLALALAVPASTLLVLVVYRTEDETARPDGIAFAGALLWRGVVYGAVDGLLLSVFPILAVFAALAGFRRRRGGTAAVAVIALAASLAMTAVYHAGYSEFRGEKLRKPVTGDVVWSAPTLLTLNPVGAPMAHIAMHAAAVVHSSETETFLPPHAND